MNATNVRTINRWRGYYMEDIECRHCKYHKGRKRGCKFSQCRFDEEKLEAIARGRIKRERRAWMRWDM